ncbi:MAG: hypothetical protein A3C58_01190 [Candidatus Staskawiczbacteria bacterium RIFCSPHIGHO2_02_FULL_34_10]|uniref:Uncharacterized protein n=1 Tax=Candidatus Staskawiczbacteria bacterium RIFCSPHIGHO2_02_FULL_34_10 TaxID=1802205 RepID=A0A1G2HWE6_9BACT|nr:MAG: hypothetical protein A3C58_01190 [Candidatus Staskawiczbacteria bacterium RIFCSPHIGHO2_02_FULL_34_10]
MVTERREEIPLPKLFEAILPYQASVYVTVLNIIQCIAFGFLVIEVKDIVNKNEFGLISILRGVNTFVIILFVWYRYVAEFQYLWPMSFMDTIIPFLIGVVECMIIFSVNPNSVSMKYFVGYIMFLQFIAIWAYYYASKKRGREFTKRLYEAFYRHPQFAFHLVNFLKKYDRNHARNMSIALVFSSIFFIIAFFWPNAIWETIFSCTCIVTLLNRAFRHSFDAYVKKDSHLGPYFS